MGYKLFTLFLACWALIICWGLAPTISFAFSTGMTQIQETDEELVPSDDTDTEMDAEPDSAPDEELNVVIDEDTDVSDEEPAVDEEEEVQPE
jgi:hypothetical protein